ncbi:undecaprenyldiphospho-muramoylpentapeptide beta-N-acetylglucosaminyltransferase [Clostridiaceae bacterium HSG29]|nr:undecaprenyldiphospho-muramoylpentapeptide beta-N-acetylglucosaminyltransferase [Clostridiaceae bacterium HSG29]
MKILVSGGGTGGHIYPAISIIESFNENDEILYVGKKNSMESRLISDLGIPFKSIIIEGFNRKNKIKNIGVVLKLILGLIQSLFIILKFRPDIVIGTGGYVSGPVVFVGAILNKKTFIHEQNAFPGVTNRILSKYVDKVFVSYTGIENKFKNDNIIFTGNPVRKKFKEVVETLEISKNDYITVLSFGGSGGAKFLNDLMFEVIEELQFNKKIQLIHVTGKKYYDEFLVNIKESKIKVDDNIQIVDYLNEMPKYMMKADLVISRAGAISISELKYTKTPSILIPSPNVTDNHQEFNAKMMEEDGLAKMILEKNINSNQVVKLIESTEFINDMKLKFNNFGNENVSKIINEEIMKEVKK